MTRCHIHITAKFRTLLKKEEIYHVTMMLECNLKLVGRVLRLLVPAKSLVTLRTAQDKAYIPLSSWASVGWSELANIYFLSHDIRRILYLVLL